MKSILIGLIVLILVITVYVFVTNRYTNIKHETINQPTDQSKEIFSDNNTGNMKNDKISINISGKIYTVNMIDNNTANEFLELLPLKLTFRDFQGQEKGAISPKKLSIEGVPSGDKGNTNDFIYYAPTNSLVFCYTDIGYWNGVIKLGTFNESIEDIKDLQDGFVVTIEG